MGSGASTRKKQQQIIAPPTTSVVPFNSNVPTDDPVVGETDVESKWGVADVDKQSSDQTITQYLTDLYAAYATGNGLRPSDLVKMMNDMSKHSGSAPDTITEEDANLVVSSMDKDGDGSVDLVEFITWIKTGKAKPKEHMDKLRDRDDQSRRLVEFLYTITADIDTNEKSLSKNIERKEKKKEENDNEKNKNNTISKDAVGPSELPNIPARDVYDTWIKDTFCHFDTDGDDKLDVAELYQLCSHIKRWALRKYGKIWNSELYDKSIYQTTVINLSNFTPRDAGMIHRALDRDKNGSIDVQEFSDWLIRGFSKDVTQLEKLASRSSNTSKMVGLLIGFRYCLVHSIGSKSDLENSLIQLFLQYDQDGDGHLDSSELLTMISAIEQTVKAITDVQNPNASILAETSALIHGQSPVITKEDVDFILGSMDTDGNGTLELPEWIAWLRAGLNRTDEQLNAIPMERQGVVRFIRSLRKHFTLSAGTNLFFATDDFETSLQRLFVQYDPDGTGCLNNERLLNMMIQLSSRNITTQQTVPTEKDSKFVINMMDMDGDGEVDVSEFVAWIMAGISKSNKELSVLASKSEQHARLIIFLRSVQKDCNNNLDNGNKNENDDDVGPLLTGRTHRTGAPIRVRISQVFTDYDADGDGHIDTYEMLALLVETACYIPRKDVMSLLNGSAPLWTVEDAQIVVSALDLDKNGVVERDEFVDWVTKGLEKCQVEENIKKMVNNSEIGLKMASFILAMKAFVGDER